MQTLPHRSPHLQVFDVAQVAILEGEQEGPGLVQLCFHLQALAVQQRELRLQHFVLQRFLHSFLGQAPQRHLQAREEKQLKLSNTNCLVSALLHELGR